ncbi:MAG: hypothetical protein PHD43_14250 [Methylococcales bacterium]|nr:hypothetical protein [Methylococcales bacterium]
MSRRREYDRAILPVHRPETVGAVANDESHPANNPAQNARTPFRHHCKEIQNTIPGI